jgi:hypothetical protein
MNETGSGLLLACLSPLHLCVCKMMSILRLLLCALVIPLPRPLLNCQSVDAVFGWLKQKKTTLLEVRITWHACIHFILFFSLDPLIIAGQDT